MRDDFDYRDLRVFEPFAGELPADIVGAGNPGAVRIAKLDGMVLGGYRLERLRGVCFALRTLGVYAPYRRRGVGRWLLGHALGVAESKGGRSVEAHEVPPALGRFLLRAGFVADDAERGSFVFHMTPE